MPKLLEKFIAARDQVRASVIDRDTEIDCLFRALICSEHVLLVGEPGTAKSYVLNMLSKTIGAKHFHHLMNKTTNVEEISGPLDIQGIKEGRFERLTEGYLPTADTATLDEIWKAGSAISNTVLTMMEERKFKHGQNWVTIPLRIVSAASNEWPTGEGYEGMQAAFDRFLIRKHVRQISPSRRRRLLYEKLPDCTQVLTIQEVDEAIAEVAALPFSSAAMDAFDEILDKLNREGIHPGDRRQRKSAKVAQAEAWLEGSKEVLPEHLEPLKDVLWVDPTEQPLKASEIICKIACPIAADVMNILVEFDGVVSKANPSKLDADTMSAQKKMKDCVERLDKLAKTGNNKAKNGFGDAKERLSEFQKALIKANS